MYACLLLYGENLIKILMFFIPARNNKYESSLIVNARLKSRSWQRYDLYIAVQCY